MAAATVTFPGGETVPALGIGTWKMGESAAARAGEVEALRTAIELGLTVIDTAEMYAAGGAEQVVGEAISGRRDGLFIVSKVLPSNASFEGVLKACDASRRRLGVAAIDLYLLHWRGSVPLAETVRAFAHLKQQGAIRHWGVSNFDVADLAELFAVDGGHACAANQVQYALDTRGLEWDLLPLMQKERMPLMAYCPLGQGTLPRHPALAAIAARHGATAAAVAIAYLLSKPGVLAIPKTARAARVRELAQARDIALDTDDLAALDRAFPPPRRKEPLAMT